MGWGEGCAFHEVASVGRRDVGVRCMQRHRTQQGQSLQILLGLGGSSWVQKGVEGRSSRSERGTL